MSDTLYLQSLLDKGGDVTIPSGRYVTAPLFIKSGTTLTFEAGAELIASTDESEYPVITTRIAGIEMKAYPGILNCKGARNVTIKGHGKINGNGPYWWNKYWGKDERGGFRGRYDKLGLRWAADYDCKRLRSVVIDSSENITLRDFTSYNAGFWNVHICYSNNVTVENIRIESGDGHGPSTDGIDIDSSSFVTVRGCTTQTNDDSICVKSGRDWDGWRVGRPSHDITIEDCMILSGFGVTLGSEVSGGIYNVTIRNLHYVGTDCGFRIKSSRPRKGYIRNIKVENLDMLNVKYPVHIALDWNPAYSYCSLPENYSGEIPEHWAVLLSKIPESVPDTQVSDITISGIRSTFSDDYAGISRAFNIEGYENEPIRNLAIKDCEFKAKEYGIISYVSDMKMDNVCLTVTGKPIRENDEYDNR